jgi:cell division protease FtsH
MKSRRVLRGPFIYLLIVLAGLWIFLSFSGRGPTPTELSFTEVEDLAQAGRIESAEFVERSQTVQGVLVGGEEFEARYPVDYQERLVEVLREADVPVAADPQSDPLRIFLNALPLFLIIGIFIWIVWSMRSQGGSRVMSFGKSKARQVTKDMPKTTFEDVAGVEEAVEELQEVKEFLENPAKFQAMGAKIPKGILLFGPPGTGKTLLARAVAGEAGVPFFSISGSDFVEMFVGVGASRVRDLFQKAKENAPAIVFIDEIDAVGRHRGAGLGGGHDEREQTLNQLLVEMDGFDMRTSVILMAGTNRPDILDPALLRPGRFDRQIVVDYPDLNGRKGILEVHARGKPLDQSVELQDIARRTPGFTGADLANLLNEAALLTARRGKERIGRPELEEAIDRVLMGPERKTRLISDKEKRIVAFHEAGHALVGFAHPDVDPVHKVTVIPRGRAGGYTLVLPTEDRMLNTRAELLGQLAYGLGGRVAEQLVFGDITTGANDDLQKASKLARRMVTEFGMSDVLGPITLGQREHEVFLGRDISHTPNYSDRVAFEIDSEVRRLIDEAHDEALELLKKNRKKLEALAEALIERETLDKDEVAEILKGVRGLPRKNGERKGAGIAAFRRAGDREGP